MLTLVLVAADPLAREGLAGLLRAAGAEVHTADAAMADAFEADLVLVVGPEPVETDLPVLALVAEAHDASEALRAGAVGVLRRTVDGARVHAAAMAVAQGLHVVDADFPDLLRLPDLEPPDEGITPREEEVLLRLAEGWSNRRIAEDLGISQRTAKFHLDQLRDKLGARSRTDVVVRAARAGLLWL